MNEQAQLVLADMLKSAMDGVDAAVEFGKAEIPVVVEQLLMWHMVESLVWFFLGLLIILAPSLTLLYIKKSWNKIKGTDGEPFIFGFCMPMLAGVFVGGMLVCIENIDWLKILIAPKLYLLEYGASLVK